MIFRSYWFNNLVLQISVKPGQTSALSNVLRLRFQLIWCARRSPGSRNAEKSNAEICSPRSFDTSRHWHCPLVFMCLLVGQTWQTLSSPLQQHNRPYGSIWSFQPQICMYKSHTFQCFGPGRSTSTKKWSAMLGCLRLKNVRLKCWASVLPATCPGAPGKWPSMRISED